jgi:hypothetical protein
VCRGGKNGFLNGDYVITNREDKIKIDYLKWIFFAGINVCWDYFSRVLFFRIGKIGKYKMSTKVQFWKNRENKSQRLLIAMNRGEFAKIKPREIQNLQFDVSFFGHFIKPNNYFKVNNTGPT